MSTEVVGDVISSVAAEQVGMDVRAKLWDSRSNRSRLGQVAFSGIVILTASLYNFHNVETE